MKKMFNQLVIAGTFDHLHSGHKKLIEAACLNANFISCGLTEDCFAKKKSWSFAMQSFKKRFLNLKKILHSKNLANRYKVSPIKDVYGFSYFNPELQAIIATKDSLSGVLQINKKRGQFSLKKLFPIIVKLVKASDRKRISSTRIRKGEINRQGLVYTQLLPNNKTLYLPSNQRGYFKKPIGKLISGSLNNSSWATLQIKKNLKKSLPSLIITVGDIATQSFIGNNLPINLAVVDFRHRRQNLAKNFHQKIPKFSLNHQTTNFPGTLSPQLTLRLKEIVPEITLFSSLQVINVNGEEDLSVLPLILLSPLNTFIFYGQPDKGIVQVKVTEKTKEKAVKLLQKFST